MQRKSLTTVRTQSRSRPRGFERPLTESVPYGPLLLYPLPNVHLACDAESARRWQQLACHDYIGNGADRWGTLIVTTPPLGAWSSDAPLPPSPPPPSPLPPPPWRREGNNGGAHGLALSAREIEWTSKLLVIAFMVGWLLRRGPCNRDGDVQT
jgi:hypothetical protein